MRYDRLTSTVTLNISELCQRADDAERSRLADSAGLELTTYRLQYSHNDITYMLIGSAYVNNDLICDVITYVPEK